MTHRCGGDDARSLARAWDHPRTLGSRICGLTDWHVLASGSIEVICRAERSEWIRDGGALRGVEMEMCL